MSTTRPFAYNTGSTISGTEQVGNLAIGVDQQEYSLNIGGVKWWMGPNEDSGYIIAKPVSGGTQPNPLFVPAYVGFNRSDSKTENSFINLTNTLFNQNFTTGSQCKTYLNNNGYWTSFVPTVSNLKLHLDASDPNSYSGTGTTWYDLSDYNNDVEMVNSGSISWNNTGAVYFSTGSNGWFSNPSGTDLPVGNSQYTFIIWVQLSTVWNANGFMSIGPFGGFNQSNAFRAGSTNQLINYWWGNDLAVVGSVSPTNGWFNAVAKYDGTTRSIWINGVSIGSDTPVGHNVTTSALQIGKTTSTEYLQGNIGEVLIYDTALSDADILQYYNDTNSRYISPTPTPTNTPTPTVTPTRTVTPTVTPTNTQTPTPTVTPSITPSVTPTITPSITPTNTITPTVTRTPTPTTPNTLVVHFDISNPSSYPGSGSTITDISGTGNNATLSGDYSYSSSNSGTIVMGGTNSLANITQNASINIASTATAVSVVIWAKIPAGYTSNDGIWNKQAQASGFDGYRLSVGGTNGLIFGFNGNSQNFNTASGNNVFTANTWAMFTTVIQAGTSAVYVNGNSTPIISQATNDTFTGQPNLQIGQSIQGDGSYLPMTWGQFRYYRGKALSTAEILTLFNADKSKYGL